MAEILDRLGRFQESRPIYQDIYPRQSADIEIGEGHCYTIRTQLHMARAHAAIGEYETALELFMDVHDWQLRNRGKDHPHTKRTEMEINEARTKSLI